MGWMGYLHERNHDSLDGSVEVEVEMEMEMEAEAEAGAIGRSLKTGGWFWKRVWKRGEGEKKRGGGGRWRGSGIGWDGIGVRRRSARRGK